ncbi:hypothetical protein H8R17_32575 [Streptomyces sp. TRM68367]|nr:hypothetical protein [Streptomyces sp. TRM68367]
MYSLDGSAGDRGGDVLLGEDEEDAAGIADSTDAAITEPQSPTCAPMSYGHPGR